MQYLDHDHKHTVKRGGSIMSGSSNYDDNIVLNTPEYNKHDLSHTFKATAKLGAIYPVLNLHSVAGDQFRFSPDIFQRFRPLVSPISSTLESILHTFYVPYRMVDFGFEKFLTGGVNGDYKRPLLTFDFPDYDGAYPYRSTCHSVPVFGIGSLCDFMNYGRNIERDLETGMYQAGAFSAGRALVASFAAYHRAYNDYYRAKEVETDLFCEIEQPQTLGTWLSSLCQAINAAVSGTSTTYTRPLLHLNTETGITDGLYPCDEIYAVLRSRQEFTGLFHWLLWYMTSPDADPLRKLYHTAYPSGWCYQASENCIHIERLFAAHATPSGTTSNTAIGCMIDYLIGVFAVAMLSPEFFPWERDRFTTALPYLMRGQSVALEALVKINQNIDESPASLIFDEGYLKHGASDQSSVQSSFTIEEFRKVNAMTRFLERNARIGYIFDEWLEGVFGIEPKKESHLTRPNYIGGTKFNAEVETITSTSETELANIGDYRGSATSYNVSEFDFSIPEHGVVIALFACKPRAALLDHIDRNNCKYADRTLFFTPDFAHLTEQPIFRDEFDSSSSYAYMSDILNSKFLDGVNLNTQILGYEPRYNEYRSMQNTTHGELLTSLVYFTTARNRYDIGDLGDGAWKNNVFFQHAFPDADSLNRIFQVDANMADHFILSIGWSIDSLRLVPRQATPDL